MYKYFKISSVALITLSLITGTNVASPQAASVAQTESLASVQASSDLLSGNVFNFKMLGLGDGNFANLTVDIPNNKLTMAQYNTQPHAYFSDMYAEVKVLDTTGKETYKKTFIGTTSYTASTDNIDIQTGYYVTVSHREASFRLLLTNESAKQFPISAVTNTYKVTASGLEIAHPELEIDSPSIPSKIKKNKTGSFLYIINNRSPIGLQNGKFDITLPPELDYSSGSASPAGATFNSTTRVLSIPIGSLSGNDAMLIRFDLIGARAGKNLPIQGKVTYQEEGVPGTTYNAYSDADTLEVVENTPPVITASDKTLTVGDTFDPKAGVTATDAEDGNITSKISVVSSSVNMNKAGVYQVKYAVTDADGNRVEKTINVTVIAKTPPVITGDLTTKLNPNASFDPMSTMKATDSEDGDITNKIVITSNDVDTSRSGTYHVQYSVKDSDDMTTTFTRTIIVTAVPVLTGDAATTININDAFDPMSTMKAVDAEDGDITNAIQVTGTVDKATAGDYTLTYKVTDSDGNIATFTRVVTVYDNTIFRFKEQPENLAFQTTEIGSDEVTIPRKDPNWKIEVEDTRHNGNQWTLTGTVNGPFVNTDDASAKQLHNALTYTTNGEKIRLQDNQTFEIGTGVSDDDTLTTIQSPADEGLQLDINPAGVKAGDNYETSITWTLSDTPD